MSQRGSLVPPFGVRAPTMDHKKDWPYNDHVLVFNETVTNKPFYLNYDCTIVTSNLANTTLSKWNGSGWQAVSGLVSPDVIVGRGFFAVTTAAAAYITLSEHVE